MAVRKVEMEGEPNERCVYDMNSASGRQRMEKLAWWSAG